MDRDTLAALALAHEHLGARRGTGSYTQTEELIADVTHRLEDALSSPFNEATFDKLSIKSGDVLVIRLASRIPPEALLELKNRIESTVPGVIALVLDQSASLTVLEGETIVSYREET